MGIVMPLGRLSGASLRAIALMRASLPGITLPSWLPATRVWSRVEPTAICWLSMTPSPLPSPSRPDEPSGSSRPGARFSRALGTLSCTAIPELLQALYIQGSIAPFYRRRGALALRWRHARQPFRLRRPSLCRCAGAGLRCLWHRGRLAWQHRARDEGALPGGRCERLCAGLARALPAGAGAGQGWRAGLGRARRVAPRDARRDLAALWPGASVRGRAPAAQPRLAAARRLARQRGR